MHRIIFCGDRYWTDDAWIRMVMSAIRKHTKFTVIEGEAPGADILSKKVAIELEIPYEGFAADWLRLGRAAGPIRNKTMLVEGKATGVVAFHTNIAKSRGTANMIEQAHKARIPIWLCTQGPDALAKFIALLKAS